MAVRFYIPGYLRQFCDDHSTVDLDGTPGTVGAALRSLARRYPGVVDRVLTESGQVRTHINIFVGEESIRYSGHLETRIEPDCEISIVPAVSGG